MISLIDADSLIYTCSYDKTPDQAVAKLYEKIDEIQEATGSESSILFLTLGKTFRHEYKSYKSNRPKNRKKPVFYYLKEFMITSLGAQYVIGLEADDLVIMEHNRLNGDTIVCSPDKDVKGQINRCYDYGKKIFTTQSDNDIQKFVWTQMLTGDSGDGVKGLPGVGPKTANKILVDINEGSDMRNTVLNEYINFFGERLGIYNFHKTYRLLKMINTWDELEQIDYNFTYSDTMAQTIAKWEVKKE